MGALSSVLKQRRKELGLTLSQVADMMGVAEATVQRWESGNIKTIRHEKIGKLAEILNVSPAVLMGWENNSPTPVSESGQLVNIVKIAGRDGSFREKRLDDKGLQALIAFVDLLPDAPDNI